MIVKIGHSASFLLIFQAYVREFLSCYWPCSLQPFLRPFFSPFISFFSCPTHLFFLLNSLIEKFESTVSTPSTLPALFSLHLRTNLYSATLPILSISGLSLLHRRFVSKCSHAPTTKSMSLRSCLEGNMIIDKPLLSSFSEGHYYPNTHPHHTNV